MAEAYISQFYSYSTGDTITAARLNGNVTNLISGLQDGDKTANLLKVLGAGQQFMTADGSNITLQNVDTVSGKDTITIHKPENDGNPQFILGAATAERFELNTVFDTGAQTLDYVQFQTKAASATADKGEFRFLVDETLTTTIDDGGVEIKASGSLSFGAVDILSDSAGTTTLSNIDAIDATTEATIETAIDTLSNLTTVGALNSGSITSGFGSIDNGASAITTTGTITGGALTVDNLVVNGNTVSSTSGNINITPVAGSNITLDGAVTVDAGVMAGITSLTVDNLGVNGNTVSSTSGNINITPVAGSNITLDGAVTIDAGVMAGITSLTVDNLGVNGNTVSSTSGNINITPVAGSNITLDGAVTVDAGVMAGITSLNTINSTELSQLTNIDSTTISTTQWGYLGAMDQGVTTTSTPTFAATTITDDLIVNTNVFFVDASSGNVGIGTATPASRLEVAGETSPVLRVASNSSDGDPSIALWDRQTSLLFSIQASQTTGVLDDVDFNTTSGTVMTMLDSGNVGIGTSTPLGAFHVESSVNSQIIIKDSGGGVDLKTFRIWNDGGTVQQQLINDAFNNIEQRFLTYNLSNGNVGIGTGTPNYQFTGQLLHIDDSANAARINLSGAATLGDIGFSDTTATGEALAQISGVKVGTTGGSLLFNTQVDAGAMATRMFIGDDGFIGIGTATPASLINTYVNDTSTDNSGGILIEQDGTGDATLGFSLTATQQWYMGVDNDDSDNFKISQNANLSSESVLINASDGHVYVGEFHAANSLNITRVSKTISTFSITTTTPFTEVNAQSGTTDDLATITAGATGEIIVIESASGDTITVKDGTGNINCGADFEMVGDNGDTMMLIYDGSNWNKISASHN